MASKTGKRGLKEISLRPYNGTLYVAPTRDAYLKAHRKMFGFEDTISPCVSGRFAGGRDAGEREMRYLVWGENPAYLAHEIAHAILDVCELAGIDPREAGGEPFCYLLSQCLLDAGVE